MSDAFDRLRAALADRYTIERELGQGGMATVYLAQDLKHHRRVAIKVLKPEVAAALGSERFLREIEIAAQLTHPHILPLHDSGQADGFLYYTMPFVEGESLRQRLTREPQLPLDEALQITREVADALGYAHALGFVHRDIKPENILFEAGHAVVADFGIARAVSAAGSERLTGTGISVGTPAYMSPEQAVGSRDVDGRSDLYSLGCVLYEMLSGEPPYTGPTAPAILAKKLSEPLPRISVVREVVPASIEAALTKALARTPADRFVTAAQFVEALTTSVALRPSEPDGAKPLRRRVVALVALLVLIVVALTSLLRSRQGAGASSPGAPLRTMAILAAPTAEDSTQWFADGIAQALEGKLSQLPGLEMHSSASLSATMARDLPIEEIGRKLHVASVLRVSVSRRSGDMRASVQLVRTSDGRMEWASDPIVAPVSNIFAVQDTIAIRAVTALKIQLGAGDAARVLARGTSVPEAYEALMRGQMLFGRMDYFAAIPLLQRAVTLDPEFAQAHASLAMAYAQLPLSGLAGSDSSLRLSRQSADRALALDSTIALAHVVRSQLRFVEFQFLDAEREARRAVALNPSDADAHQFLAAILGSLGRLAEGLEENRAALRIDPMHANALLWNQIFLYTLHRFDEAVAATKVLLEMEGTSTPALANLAEIYTFGGNGDSAVAVARKLLANRPDEYGTRAYAMFAFASAGQWAAADSQRAIMQREPTNSPHYNQTMIALVDGDPESAARAMDIGIEAREPVFNTVLLGCELYFDRLKANARYLATLKRLGVEPCPPLPRWPIPPRPR